MSEESTPNETHESISVESAESSDSKSRVVPWLVTAGIIALIGIAGLIFLLRATSSENAKASSEKATPEAESHNGETGGEVALEPDALAAAGLQVEVVSERPSFAKVYVTGSVELNPEKTEFATPLVGGRIERVLYAVGDRVSKGAVLAVISSPQLAQMHGKMHEARTRFELAERNLARVRKAENRVAVLQAKARLDEAEATLKRTRRLIELGAGAGKDLVAAEAAYKTAKAEYDFQSNISLNREIQEAAAEVETSRVDVKHIEDELRALGVHVDPGESDDHKADTSLVAVRSPLSGVITERRFNAGAGIEPATPIFSVSDLGTVYIIANVPESQVARLNIGAIAEIRSAATGSLSGRISYIDPKLDEATRTARVRVEVANPNGNLRAGMFTEVGLFAGESVAATAPAIRSEAIQRDGDKAIVFVPKDDEPGAFEVREVEIGGESGGYTTIISGLKLGEKVVTTGSFVLKAKLQKGSLGDHAH
ncbi:MAG: RND family efflux transporter MFP subunit [Acidobacteria bacterium OLB17]|nr:MAG: RND family efflux transporter MFP subunit [Acidobacteria bacterium OLB17]MCZ2390012.1 efflux RND transporter periplasmic adaptor subunit [Acidobacteriota bacterium]